MASNVVTSGCLVTRNTSAPRPSLQIIVVSIIGDPLGPVIQGVVILGVQERSDAINGGDRKAQTKAPGAGADERSISCSTSASAISENTCHDKSDFYIYSNYDYSLSIIILSSHIGSRCIGSETPYNPI